MDDLRNRLKRSSEEYKSAWFKDFGKQLHEVRSKKLFKNWRDDLGYNFKSFTSYCEHDLKISSTVASDIARAYEYIHTHHRKLIGQFPSDGIFIPGYNEINILIRAKNRLPESEYIELDKQLFSGQLNRERLVEAVRTDLSARESRYDNLERKIRELENIISEQQGELHELKQIKHSLAELNKIELGALRRNVSKMIHPDAGGHNDLMRDFNSFMDIVQPLHN